MTKESLTNYYNGLQWVCDSKGIITPYKYNIDETAMQLGETNGNIVAGTVMTASSERIKSDNSTWSSVLEAIFADSRRLTRCIVVTGKNL